MTKSPRTQRKHNGLALMVRLDKRDAELLVAAAADQFTSVHQLGRAVIQTYLAGYVGPYVLRKPPPAPADGGAGETLKG